MRKHDVFDNYGGSTLFPAYLFHGKTFWRFLFLLAILWLVIISISKMCFGKISVRPHTIIMHTALCLTKQYIAERMELL